MLFRRSSSLVYSFVAATLLLAHGSVQATAVSMSAWDSIYQGIDYATATVEGSKAYAMRIDLTAPGIAFYTTPKGGSLDTVSSTTSQFLKSSGAQVAINANFFTPCCATKPQNEDLRGLEVSNGTVVSAPTFGASGVGTAVMLLTQSNHASITTTVNAGSVDLSTVYTAVAGSGIIVRDGQNISAQHPSYGEPGTAQPRTDFGISQDGKFLFLVAIDGRQAGYSTGATMNEAADLMILLGAYTALNLDGGGSTELVRADGNGGALLLNRPSGGAERYVGSNFGVYANAVPVPAAVYFLGSALLSLGGVARKRARRLVVR